ncbi:hypothetical protein PI125_g17938 [Phytophthora idaei]|nr:hypothetical protein PI125_g17938 [Phytophthora idaei]KAG3147129.1 hypothetical protein PI126_g12988 [Phytophthora idaei]
MQSFLFSSSPHSTPSESFAKVIGTQKSPSIPSTGPQNYRPNRSNLTKAERYQCAIDAVDAGIPVREAAKRFEVAREYLRLRFLGLRPLDCRRDPQLLYINEDADVGLLEAIEFRAARGMCIGTSQFRELVPRSSTGNVSEACSGQLSWQEEDPKTQGRFRRRCRIWWKASHMEAVVKSKAAAAEAKVKAKREAAETRAAKKVEAAALKTARQAAAAVASCPSIVNRSSGDHLHVWSGYARNFSTASQLIEE